MRSHRERTGHYSYIDQKNRLALAGWSLDKSYRYSKNFHYMSQGTLFALAHRSVWRSVVDWKYSRSVVDYMDAVKQWRVVV